MLQSQELIASNQIITKINRKNTEKNSISKSRTIYNKRYTEITKYDERIYGKNKIYERNI